MAKWHGEIGFGIPVETSKGNWDFQMVRRYYDGEDDITVGRTESTEFHNDNVRINNTISIVADPFARDNFYNIKYVTYAGMKWKLSSAEIKYPRITLTMGEIYNDKDSS